MQSKCYQARHRARGELAARDLSAKARLFLDGCDCVALAEYDTDDGPRYALQWYGDPPRDGLTLRQVEAILEEYQQQSEEALAADEDDD